MFPIADRDRDILLDVPVLVTELTKRGPENFLTGSWAYWFQPSTHGLELLVGDFSFCD
jgi:hypothetical protein